MNKFKKCIRMIVFREKIFGNIGINNVFSKGVIVSELATIGNYNYFGFNSLVVNACIANYCSIAPSVIIGPADHSKDFFTTYNPISSRLMNFEMFHTPTIIGNDVWIGANVVIRQGVKIGNGAIIGANSFVKDDVPDFSIVAGSPARFLKYRFSENIIYEINKSAWWNFDIKDAKSIISGLIEKNEGKSL